MIEFLRFVISGWLEFTIVAMGAVYIYLLLVSMITSFKPVVYTVVTNMHKDDTVSSP